MTKILIIRKILWKFVMVLTVFSLSLGLSSCARKEQKKAPQLFWWGDIYNQAFARKLVQVYNSRKSSDEKISLLTSTDYWNKLQTMLAGGAGPDIMLVDPSRLVEFSSRGVLLCLDDYKNDPEYIDFQEDTWKNLKGEFTYNGHLYAVPIWTNSIGIFYNKDLFDQAGVEYPSKDWDLDEFLKKAKQLTLDTDGDGKIDQFGFGSCSSFWSISPWGLHLVIKSFGGELYSQDLEKCLIDTPEAIAAVRWAVELVTKHHVAPSISESSSGRAMVSSGGIDLFRLGKVAMVRNGRWYLDVLSTSKDLNWAVAPFPKGKEKVMFQVPIYMAIYSKTKYPQQSWDFIKFMISNEGQRLLVLNRTEIPVRSSIAYSQEYLTYGGRQDANKVFLEMLEYAEMPVFPPGATRWKDSAGGKLQMALMGKLPVEVACKEIAQEFLSK
ncbi:sugar ABC transporter substrate-binding protein [Candidatus Calescamantes bacterium]|nr:sugar ABC transporter substrate-binding protein [Candidatus Calescamantes bacterium]